MTRSEPGAFLATEAGTRGVARDVRPSCLVCGARIASGEPTIKIHGAPVHMLCAVRRRRVARR
jgi:hypothetical protein